MPRPGPEEHHEYYSTYIDKVPDEPILDVLRQAPDALDELLSGLSPADEHHAYAEGKWTLREAVGHVADTERIFAQRALHIAREDASPLPGMDQNVWAAASNAAQRPLASLLAEFRHQRQANVELFASFDDEILDRRGIASGFEFSVRALVYIVAGHELHHRAILVERYLPTLGGGDGARDA